MIGDDPRPLTRRDSLSRKEERRKVLESGHVEDWAAWYFPHDTRLSELARHAVHAIPQAHTKPREVHFVKGKGGGPSVVATGRRMSLQARRVEPSSIEPTLQHIGAKLHSLRVVVVTELTDTLNLVVKHISFQRGLQRTALKVIDPAQARRSPTPGGGENSPPLSPRIAMDMDGSFSASGLDRLASLNLDQAPQRSMEIRRAGASSEDLCANANASFEMVEMEDRELKEVLDAALHAIAAFNLDVSAVLKEEVAKVNSFYHRTSYVVSGASAAAVDASKVIDALPRKQKGSVERTFQQAAYSLSMLQQFCDQNYVLAAQFINNIADVSYQRIEVGKSLEALPFFLSRQDSGLRLLRKVLVDYYAENLCDGDHDTANGRLIAFTESDSQENAQHATLSVLFWVGATAGCLLSFFCAVVVLFSATEFTLHVLRGGEHAAYLFTLSAVPIVFGMGFALNVFVWEQYSINFAFSLGLHPFRHFTSRSLLFSNGIYAVVWLSCVFLYLRASFMEFIGEGEHSAMHFIRDFTNATCPPGSETSDCAVTRVEALKYGDLAARHAKPLVPAYLWPYIVFPLLLVWGIVSNLLVRFREMAIWFVPSLLRILVTPLYSVTFEDFFICEQLVSLSHVLYEAQFAWCVFVADTDDVCATTRSYSPVLLAALPSLWRTMQSIRRFVDAPQERTFYPHMLNATKYSISLVRYACVMLFAVFHRKGDDKQYLYSDTTRVAMLVLMIVAYTVDSSVKMWYETYVEYGVGRVSAKNFLLRDNIMFPWVAYYVAVPLNTVMRWFWIMEILVVKMWHPDAKWTFALFACVEACRRILWNFFRVEHDQVDNTENYKAVSFAPLEAFRHASAHVDWQVTEEDLDQRFNAALPERATPHMTHNNSATWDGAHTDPGQAPATPNSLASFDQIRASNTQDPHGAGARALAKSLIFFAQLPRPERIEVLRGVLPSSAFASGTATGHGSRQRFFFPPIPGVSRHKLPPTRLFAALREEDKVRALLLRIGKNRTASGYLDAVKAEEEFSVTAPPRRSSSILRAAELHNNARHRLARLRAYEATVEASGGEAHLARFKSSLSGVEMKQLMRQRSDVRSSPSLPHSPPSSPRLRPNVSGSPLSGPLPAPVSGPLPGPLASAHQSGLPGAQSFSGTPASHLQMPTVIPVDGGASSAPPLDHHRPLPHHNGSRGPGAAAPAQRNEPLRRDSVASGLE